MARRLKRRRVLLQRDRERESKKRIASLRPWVVRAYYMGHHWDYDRLLFKLVGKPSDGSGTWLRGPKGGERDHYWNFANESDARQAADSLVRVPGIDRVVLEGNMTEAIELYNLTTPPDVRRRRRRRLKRVERHKRSSS